MYKKLLIIFAILFAFSIKYNCLANTTSFSSEETHKDIVYVKYNGSIYYYRYLHVIRNTSDGNVAYCVEPFVDLIDGVPYTGYSKYNPSFGLSEEVWNKIRLIAYYGYGYKNHTDYKWVSITQIMIWRTINPNYSFNWVDSVSSKKVIYPYEKELNELKNLVDNHKKMPNISSDFSISLGSTVVIEDTNEVLSSFSLDKVPDGLSVVLKENTLSIEALEDGEYYLSFTRKGDYNKSSTFFYQNGTQKLIERGNPDPISFTLHIVVESGSITVKKVDFDSNDTVSSGEASLIGAVYNVFSENDELVGKITIGDDYTGFINKLPYGMYYVKEDAAGCGYTLDSNTYEVLIGSNSKDVSLKLNNKVISSNIIIKKLYGSKDDELNNKMLPEEGVNFNVYDSNNNLYTSGKTDKNGELSFILPYGKYLVVQMNSADGYEKVRDFSIVIDENTSPVLTYELKDIKIDVPNASSNPLISNEYLLISSYVLFCLGVYFGFKKI